MKSQHSASLAPPLSLKPLPHTLPSRSPTIISGFNEASHTPQGRPAVLSSQAILELSAQKLAAQGQGHCGDTPLATQQQSQQSRHTALSSGVEAPQAESGAGAKATEQGQKQPLQLNLPRKWGQTDAEVPVISMLRTSDSQNSERLDLGYIKAHTSLTWVGGCSGVDGPMASVWC